MTKDQSSLSVLLIDQGSLILLDGSALSEVIGWLAVEGERIAAIGSGDAPAEWRQCADRIIDARQMAVLPGLVNGHTHLSQTFMRGLADGRPLLRWLKEVIWPLQAAMTPDDLYLAAKLGLVENLRCGATTVVQHHKLPGRDHVAAVVQAAADLGICMVLARGWVDMGATGEPPDQILSDMRWLHDNLQSTVRNPRSAIRIASGPLAAWRCSDDAMREIAALARSWGAATHIHVSEAQEEVEMSLQRCGKRPIEWLADIDVLGPDVQLVHAVHLTDAEIDLIAQSGATVVHCPTSNMYLASGAAPVRKMLDRGIPVALGTDGSGSNNSQDLLECAKIGALLAKHATGDAQALLPADIIRMLTVDGARLRGQEWENGRKGEGEDASPAHSLTRSPLYGHLAPGAPADITIVNLNNARCQPVHSAASALVYNASGADVHTVIVGGEILLDAGRVVRLDEAGLFESCRVAADDLMRRAGIARFIA
jgi:5-methylthioadenosine/S-adenosylhomocysteine deaminase